MAALRAASAFAASTSFRSFEGLKAQSSECHQEGKLASRVSVAAPQRPLAAPLVVAQGKAPKRKQIILIKDVPQLGKEGQLVTVKRGYFRNFLYPFGKAKNATPEILKAIEDEKRAAEEAKRVEKEAAEKIARQLQTIGGLTVRRKSATGKTFFGSVTETDIADIIKANTGREIEKKNIVLPSIKETGQYVVEIKLHAEVIAQVKVNVVGGKS
eukprot:jgi/Mesen1/1460/ME000132S00412